MTIRDIAISFGYEIDEKSERAAQDSIEGLKNMASRALGALAIGVSLTELNAIAEEFNGVNDQIKNATRELGDQKDIQQRILQAANDTKTSYADTAKVVSNLVQENSELFGNVDEAIHFNNAVTRLFKTAGKSNEEIAGLMEAINKSFAKGAVDSETINQLTERAPEAVALLNRRLGTTSVQLAAMASQGTISLADLKGAFTDAAAEIDGNFAGLDYSISDALLNIRNQWGLWVDGINSSLGISNKLSKALVQGFSSFMDILRRAQTRLEWFTDRIGGLEQVVKLIGIILGSVFGVAAVGKIVSVVKAFQSMDKALLGVRLKALGLIAVVALIALLVEDFIYFMQGKDSLIGEMFSKAGIDADKVRKTITRAWLAVWKFLTTVWNGIQKAGKTIWDKWGGAITATFGAVWKYLVLTFSTIWNTLVSLARPFLTFLEGLIQFLTGVFLGDWEMAWEGAKKMFSGWWDGITTILENAFAWFKGLKDIALQWGSDMLQGFIDGIAGKVSKVVDAVKDVGEKIRSFLHFSVPDQGPLKDYQSWMPDFMSELAEGIEANKGKLLDALRAVTGDMSVIAKLAVASPGTASAAASNTMNRTINQYVEINNEFKGDTAGQQKSSQAMKGAAKDATDEMARALNYNK